MKPKPPPTIEELPRLWQDYYLRLEKWRERKRKHNARYFSTPKGKEAHIRAILKSMQNPKTNYEFLEKILRGAERTRSLDAPIGETNLYAFIPAKTLKEAI